MYLRETSTNNLLTLLSRIRAFLMAFMQHMFLQFNKIYVLANKFLKNATC
jgi:hypothetical protein